MSCDEKKVFITFFVPCLNEEENIIKTVETILYVIGKVGKSYEIIIVDDHSTDNTVAAVEKYQNDHPDVNLKLVRNNKTYGLGRNYCDTAYIGAGEYYMCVFGDNTGPADALLALVEKAGQADMIIPYLSKDIRTFSRRMLSRFFVFLVNFLSGYKLKYYNGPIVHRRYNVMRWHPDTLGFAYQAEIVTRLLNEGATFIEVPIHATERGGGVSKALRLQNFLSVTHSLLQISLRRLRKVLYNA